jgi:hypothetical protein
LNEAEAVGYDYINASLFRMINDLSISLSSFNCAISLIASGVYKLYGNEAELEFVWEKEREIINGWK